MLTRVSLVYWPSHYGSCVAERFRVDGGVVGTGVAGAACAFRARIS